MAAATTDLPPIPEPSEPPSGSGGIKKLVIAAVIGLILVLGLKLLLRSWMSRGGPRKAISGLVEDGAVSLADALLDEVFPAP